VPDKTVSRAVVPDVLLSSYRPALTGSWELAVAGWAVAIGLVKIGGLVASFAAGFQSGMDGAFTGVAFSFIGGAATVLAVTAVARLRRPQLGGAAVSLLSLGLALFGFWGALTVVVALVGLVTSFGAGGGGGTVFYLVMQHIGGAVLGVVVMVWAAGEVAHLSRPEPGTPAAEIYAKVWSAPGQVKAKLADSWELAVLGYVVAMWLFTIASFSQGAMAELGAFSIVLTEGGPVGVAAVTIVARLRWRATNNLGRFCIDLALLLATALGAVLVVVSIIDIFKSFGMTGADVVIGALMWSLAGLVMGVLTVVWGTGEIAVLRDVVPAATVTLAEAAGAAPGFGGNPLTPPAGTVVAPPATAGYGEPGGYGTPAGYGSGVQPPPPPVPPPPAGPEPAAGQS
jgi:hypothetical protein